MELRELMGPLASGVGFQVLVTVLLWTLGRGSILVTTRFLGGSSPGSLNVAQGISLTLSAALFITIVLFVGPGIATFAALVLAMGLETAWRGPAMGARQRPAQR